MRGLARLWVLVPSRVRISIVQQQQRGVKWAAGSLVSQHEPCEVVVMEGSRTRVSRLLLRHAPVKTGGVRLRGSSAARGEPANISIGRVFILSCISTVGQGSIRPFLQKHQRRHWKGTGLRCVAEGRVAPLHGSCGGVGRFSESWRSSRHCFTAYRGFPSETHLGFPG